MRGTRPCRGGQPERASSVDAAAQRRRARAPPPQRTSRQAIECVGVAKSPAQASATRWQPLGGPAEGGYIFAVAVDPADSNVVYAGGLGNVFKSTDGGVGWKDVTDEPWTDVGALAIDPGATAHRLRGHRPRHRQDQGRRPTLAHGQYRPFRARAAAAATASLAESFVQSLTIDAKHPATVYATTSLGLYRTRTAASAGTSLGRPFSDTRSSSPRAGSRGAERAPTMTSLSPLS